MKTTKRIQTVCGLALVGFATASFFMGNMLAGACCYSAAMTLLFVLND